MDFLGQLLCLVSPAARAAQAEMREHEVKAEAAYTAMYDAPRRGAKDFHDDAQMYFNRAIKAAERAYLYEEARRLKTRSDHVQNIFNSQFRYMD